MKSPPILKLIKSSYFYLICLGYLLSTALVSPFELSAYEIALAWDANNEPDLEGYKLYSRVGNPCPPYNHIDRYSEGDLVNPLLPTVKVTNLEDNKKYYFVVTAYDSEGFESDYSNIVYVINGKWGNADCSSPQVGSSSGSGGGGGCYIATSVPGLREIKVKLAIMYLFAIGLVSFVTLRRRSELKSFKR